MKIKARLYAGMMTIVLMVLCLYMAPGVEAEAAATPYQVITTMECSIWSAPNTAEQYRVKRIPVGYTLTIYPEVVKSTGGDGKTFYRTIKGAYVLCKCIDGAAIPTQPAVVDHRYGYANNLPGRTLVVTLFTSDSTTAWTAKDSQNMLDLYEALGIATDYIEQQCAAYGVASEFLYEWDMYPDLGYYMNLGFDVRTDKYAYSKMKDEILAMINPDALLAKYGAQNLVFIAALNTDRSNTSRNWTYMSTPSYPLDVEIAKIQTQVSYGNGVGHLLPSSIAHEILHAFGAPDLYVANETINQTYVDYLNKKNLSDIMRSTNYGKYVSSSITGISAYYLGLAPSCADVQTYGLGLTEKVY